TDTVKSEPSNFKIKYGDLVLSDFSFAYIDYNDTSKTSGMNFSNLELTDLNGVIKKIKIKEDEICLDIRGLQLKEKSGFELRKLNTDLKISPSEISMENLELITGNSSIFGKLKTNQKDYESFTDFINKVKINADLKNNSVIGSRDIVFFVPDLNSFSENVKLSGNFSGEINNLKGKNVFVGVTNQTRFAGNFHIKNVTQSDSMYSDLDIKELTTSASDLINIGIPGMSLNDRKAAFIPIMPFGNTSYNGKI
ncbi:MAG: hypothetical protein ACK452_01915, partial [Bacteroidota bacterium]